MHRYRVPKNRIPVRISLRDQSEKIASIFVAERAESHSGPERPSDVMNRPDPFIALEEAGGTMEFLQRQAVAFLAVPIDAEFERAVPGSGATFRLTLTLDDGRCFEGAVRYQLPDSARRLQDILNLPDRFLRLERGGEILLVNKHRIVSARPLLEGDEPSDPN